MGLYKDRGRWYLSSGCQNALRMSIRDISTAPRDRPPFQSKNGSDAIAMLWHVAFEEPASSWRENVFLGRRNEELYATVAY